MPRKLASLCVFVVFFLAFVAGIWRFSGTPAETSPALVVGSGVANLILLLLSFLLLVLFVSCPRIKTFGAVWIWCGVTVCTLLIQVVITAFDLVLLEMTPDAVYSGSLANSLMYTACQALYVCGVVAFALTEPPPPRAAENMRYATAGDDDNAIERPPPSLFRRGAADDDDDGAAVGGVLAASGIREPAPQARLVELPLGPDENAMAVSFCGTLVVVESPLGFVLLDVPSGERIESPKDPGCHYTYALGQQHGVSAVLVVAETAIPRGAFSASVVPSPATTVLHFVSGPRWSAAEIEPYTLPGAVDLLEAGRGGLVVATLRGTGEAVVLQLGECRAELDSGPGPAPTGVVQLSRTAAGDRIDAVVAAPPPGAACSRFYVASGVLGGFRPAPEAHEAAVVSHIAGAKTAAAAEVFRVPGNPRTTFISLGPGRPLGDYGLPVGAVIWWSALKFFLVVLDDIVPMLVPVCRGSGALEASLFPESAPLMKRLSYATCPVATAGPVLLCHGRVYMVEE